MQYTAGIGVRGLSLILEQQFKHSGSLKICRSVFYNPAVIIKNAEKYFIPSAESNTNKQTNRSFFKHLMESKVFIFSPQCLPSRVNTTTLRSADDAYFPVIVPTFSKTCPVAFLDDAVHVIISLGKCWQPLHQTEMPLSAKQAFFFQQ